jgi:NAD(P)-dependent dehydrogenase (short-subunit alcohol dehydrogenase family)
MRTTRALSFALGMVAAGYAAARAWREVRAIDFDGKSVVIVGGSRGLGLVIARQLAAQGARLTLVARDADELDRAQLAIEELGAPGTVATLACDIRDRDQVERTIAKAATERNGIDVLINDAGVIQVGPMSHMSVDDFEDAMRTHFWGPLYTILAALPHLRQSPAARIVNISSIGGKVAVPHLLPYSASKFALTGLSEGLHAELARENIHVTTVCPGLMRTGSTYNAWFKGDHRREFAWFHLAASLPVLSIDAERAARQILAACRRGDAELVLTMPARLAVVMNAICPGTTASMMATANLALPAPIDAAGSTPRSGWQSVSSAAPSFLSKAGDRATVDNNEVPHDSLRIADC